MAELRYPIETMVQLIANAIGGYVNDDEPVALLDDDGQPLLDDDGEPLTTSEMHPRIFLGFDAHSPKLPYVTLNEIDTVEFKTARGGVDGGSNTGLSEKRVQVAIYATTHAQGVRMRQKLIDKIGHTGEPVDALPLRISDITPDFTTYQHDAEERWHKFTVDFMLQIEDARTQGEL